MIKYVIHAKKWFDKVNGNTYHSARVLDTEQHLQLAVPFQYGYGDHFLTTTQQEMIKQKWIQKEFKGTDYQNIHFVIEENCKKKDVLAWGNVA
tara:strand:- start:292 stop:570 length:279 start_codon:yes stop_codon:yes gene_type:complete